MIRSMTGFATAEKCSRLGLFSVEIKTLNNKFLDTSYRLPNNLVLFDDRVKALVKGKLKRGKVYLNLVHEAGEGDLARITINEELAKSYSDKLKKLKKKIKIDDQIGRAHV